MGDTGNATTKIMTTEIYLTIAMVMVLEYSIWRRIKMVNIRRDINLDWHKKPQEFVQDLGKAVMYGYDNNLIMPIPVQFNKLGYDAFFNVFKCQRCGKCCLSMPNNCPAQYISVTDLELQLLKPDLPGKWEDKIVRVPGGYRMNFPCLLYSKGMGCRAYERRPKPCKDWPLTVNPLDMQHFYVNAFCPGGAGAIIMLYKFWYNKMNKETLL